MNNTILLLLKYSEEYGFELIDQNNQVVTRALWNEYKELIDDHYENSTDKDIDVRNAQLNDFNESILNAKSLPSITKESGVIYLIKAGNVYKIGVTKNIQSRIKTIQTSNPNKVEVIQSWKSYNHQQIETTLHRLYENKKLLGEWFSLSSQDVEDIKKYVNDFLESEVNDE